MNKKHILFLLSIIEPTLSASEKNDKEIQKKLAAVERLNRGYEDFVKQSIRNLKDQRRKTCKALKLAKEKDKSEKKSPIDPKVRDQLILIEARQKSRFRRYENYHHQKPTPSLKAEFCLN